MNLVYNFFLTFFIAFFILIIYKKETKGLIKLQFKKNKAMAGIILSLMAVGLMNTGVNQSHAASGEKNLVSEQRVLSVMKTPLSQENKYLSSQEINLVSKTEDVEQPDPKLVYNNYEPDYNNYQTSYAESYEPPSIEVNATGAASTVVNYALGMVGGRYVWGGSSYGATDCSGLVMLSYAQVGINLPHQASAQAYYGTTISFEEMQPGDLIFYGYGSYNSIYHVAMYIGNGQIVEAQSSATGIIINSAYSSSNNIVTIKRLI